MNEYSDLNNSEEANDNSRALELKFSIGYNSSMTGAGEWGALVSAPSNQTQTGVEDVQANKTVAGVKYVNLAGQMSETAFSGVNIVVTTYTDGTTSTVKVIK